MRVACVMNVRYVSACILLACMCVFGGLFGMKEVGDIKIWRQANIDLE